MTSPASKNEIQDMRDHAERFRRLARVVEDERNRQQLLDMAKELDEGANSIEEIKLSKKR